ncbi:MAG: hypothetical protein QM733_09340 [Ilumatobacteraceae bacterium]
MARATTTMPVATTSVSVIVATDAAARERWRAMSRMASRGASGRQPASRPATSTNVGATSTRPTTTTGRPATSRAGLGCGRVAADIAIAPAPAATSTTPASTGRRTGRGGTGRPESAAITGIRDAVRAGHHAASVEVTTARSPMTATSIHGSCNGPTSCCAVSATLPRTACQTTIAAAVPATAPATPTIVPQASIATCRWRRDPPTAASRPSWRCRRWAIVTNPAAATSPTRIIAIVTTTPTSTSRPSVPRAARYSTRTPSPSGPVASPVTRRSTCCAGGAPSGSTSANVLPELEGLATMPTSVRGAPSIVTVSPSAASKARAAEAVSATSALPCGNRPSRRASIGAPSGASGSWAMTVMRSTEPGTTVEPRPMRSTSPNCRRAAVTVASAAAASPPGA